MLKKINGQYYYQDKLITSEDVDNVVNLIQQKLSEFNLNVFHYEKCTNGVECEIIDEILKPYNKVLRGYYSGCVNLHEYLDITIAEFFERGKKNKRRIVFNEDKFLDMLPVAFKNKLPEFRKLAEEFESKNIPSSGPSKTLIGEIFRSIQYIQYRSFNDGDLPWNILSPTFESYVFVLTQIEYLNREYGKHCSFKFKDVIYCNEEPERELTSMIEDHSCLDANFIKYELIELLNSGQIKNERNDFDSRRFLKIWS